MGAITLLNGKRRSVVLVGPIENPKGAVLIPMSDSGEHAPPETLQECAAMLTPQHMIDILCAQERAFGKSGLEPLDLGG